MDAPAWHPANEKSDEWKTGGTSRPPRTEFKVMPGSHVDTSTEAGRQLVNSTGDKFFLDASDRLYLFEQQTKEIQDEEQKRSKIDADLKKFRQEALKQQKGSAVVEFLTNTDSRQKDGKSTAHIAPILTLKRKEKKKAKETRAKRPLDMDGKNNSPQAINKIVTNSPDEIPSKKQKTAASEKKDRISTPKIDKKKIEKLACMVDYSSSSDEHTSP